MKQKKGQNSSKLSLFNSALHSALPLSPGLSPRLSSTLAASVSSTIVSDPTSYTFNRLYREHKLLDSEIARRVARGIRTWDEADKITVLKKLKLKYKELLDKMSSRQISSRQMSS